MQVAGQATSHSPQPPRPETTSNDSASTTALGSVPVAKDFAKPPNPRRFLQMQQSASYGSSNPQQWFDHSNNNPQQSQAFQGANEGSSPHTGDLIQASPQRPPSLSHGDDFNHPMMLPFRGGLPAMGLPDDSGEDYRSVIDDLTVRNRRLRAKLRRYEHQRQMDEEKLIEVKIHGLSPAKKLELEDMLKRFVRGVEETGTTKHGSDVSEPAHVAALSTIANKPSSSHTSTKFADSGYGSLAASNQGLAQRAAFKPYGDGHPVPSRNEASQARNRTIQSYLHDIPEGLLPRQSTAVMTEDAKKRMVVSRLEHLFSGRGAALDGHQQPMQQQEVSQLAARENRSAIEARGQRAAQEGKREAPIMSNDFDEPTGIIVPKQGAEGSTNAGDRTSPEKHGEHFMAVEQRPTRPLDLDPHRAQDPLENIEYLRHLGFKFHNDLTGEDSDGAVEKGWVYLNMIMNMAQLHTLNVTHGLVKEAVTQYSSRFELSSDGRKLRWRKDPLPTMINEDVLAELPSSATNQSSKTCRTRKRVRTSEPTANSSLESSELSTVKRAPFQGSSERSHNLSTYVSQPGTSELVEDSEMPDCPSMPSYAAGEDRLAQESSAWTSSGNLVPRAESSNRRSNESMVFYKQQHFFTDLSGDRPKFTRGLRSNYFRRPVPAIGATAPGLARQNSDSTSLSASVQAAVSTASLDVHAEADSTHDNGSVQSERRHSSPNEPAEPYPFEASGLGCTYPTDNFVMYITRELEVDDQAPPVKRRKLSKLQDGLADALPKPDHHVSETMTSLRGKLLDPSPLPPPNYAFSADGSDTDMDEEEDEAEPSYEYSENAAAIDDDDISLSNSDISDTVDTAPQSEEPSKSDVDKPQPSAAESDCDVSSKDSEIESEASADLPRKLRQRLQGLPEARSSPRGRMMKRPRTPRSNRSESVDLLASARQADPKTIVQKEREYDAELAERLAEEMPAGSSAATHGGKPGSGFNSPVPRPHDDMDVDAYDGQEVEGSVSS